MKILKTSIIMSFLFFSDVSADELKLLLHNTLESCISSGWLECDKQFYGPNRGIFRLAIEMERSKKIQAAYLGFLSKYYGQDCDKSSLIRASFGGKAKVSFDLKRFLADNIKISKNSDGSVVYELDNGDKMALLPHGNNYKIMFNNKIETSLLSFIIGL